MSITLRTGKILPGFVGLLIVLAALLLISGCTQTTTPQNGASGVTGAPIANMTNPASTACVQSGGSVDIKKDATGAEYGMCTFANGTSCEEWALFRGEGCKSGVTAVTTTAAEGKKMVTFTEADNGKTSDTTQGTRFAVTLKENPTTGFAWNATVSPGLVIESSIYTVDPDAHGRMGAGGNHTWVITGKDLGAQKFSATYLRSWEPVTGNETAYTVNVQVVKA